MLRTVRASLPILATSRRLRTPPPFDPSSMHAHPDSADRRWSKWLDFAGCWVRNPASVFAVLGEVLPLFLAISGDVWLFLGWVRPQVGRAQK